MKRVLISVFVIFILLIGGLLIAPSFVDWNQYKGQILGQLEKATGHKYLINGSIDLAVLPYPQLLIEGFEVLPDPSHGQQKPLVSLERASVQLGLLPLLKKNVVVKRLRLSQPIIYVSVDSNGTASWMTPVLESKLSVKEEAASAEDTRPKSFDPGTVALDEIEIRGGHLVYADLRKGGAKHDVRDINIDLNAASLFTGPYKVDGGFIYGEQYIKVSLETGVFKDFKESIPVEFSAALPNLKTQLDYKGVVQNTSDHGIDAQGEVSISVDQDSALLEKVMSDASYRKKISSNGILSFSGDSAAYKNASVRYGDTNFAADINLEGLKRPKNEPLTINASLKGDGAFDATDLIKGLQKNKKAGEQKTSFLPQSITMPRDITGSFSFSMPSLKAGDVALQDVLVAFKKSGRTVDFDIGSKSLVRLDGNIVFQSNSVSSSTGEVVLSEPVVTTNGQFNVNRPAEWVKAFGIRIPNEAAKKILQTPIKANFEKAKIKDNEVSIDTFSVNVYETPAQGKIRYTLAEKQASKPMLDVSISASGVDGDKWERLFAPVNAPVASDQKPVKSLQDLEATIKNINLPVDMKASLNLQNVRYKTKTYTELYFNGNVLSNSLTIENAGAKDAAGNAAKLSGKVQSLSELSGIDMTASFSSPAIEPFVNDFLNKPLQFKQPLGRVNIVGSYKGNVKEGSFVADLDAQNAKLEAEGVARDILRTPDLGDLTLRLRHPDFHGLVRFFAPDFPVTSGARQTIDLYTAMQRDKEQYKFKKVQLGIGNSKINGDVDVLLSGVRPSVLANLTGARIDLNSILGKAKPSSAASPSNASQGGNNANARWSRNAIKTEGLFAADIDLKARIDKLLYDAWDVQNVTIDAALKNGQLNIRDVSGALYGGVLAAKGGVQAVNKPKQPLSVNADLRFDNVSLEQLVQSFSGKRLVKAQGNVSMNTNISTSGLSPAALIFGLSGKGALQGQNLMFEGFDLAKLSRTLAAPSSSFTKNFNNLLGGTMSGGVTSFETLNGTFTINEGVIRTNDLALNGLDASILTTGNVNLPLWTLDLQNAISLSEPKDAPKLNVAFKGPIDNPGQTFGRAALEQYFQSQLQQMIFTPLLDKLNDKAGLTPKTSPMPSDGTANDPAPIQQQPKKAPSTEEAIFGIIQGIIKE